MYYLLTISETKGCDVKKFNDEHDLIVYCRNKFELNYRDCTNLEELDYSLYMLDDYDFCKFYESKYEMLKDILDIKFDIDEKIVLLRNHFELKV